uniref:Serpentine receptor class gamma n=1 Tax=Haemonchus contortus TaxID=6289 RepID=A0A7I5EBP6_HAECO
VHHLTVSFLFVSPCEIIMPKPFFIATSLPLFYSIGAAQFAQMSMIAERWIAIIFVRDYESGYKKLGPALIAATVIINCCSMYIMYYGETFDAPQWNARSMPSTTYPRSSVVLMILLVLNFISLLVTIILYVFSRKRRRTMTLSSKFQSNENAIVSNLLFMISSLQFATSFFAQLCGLYLRSYQSKNPLRFAYRENFDLFNYYTLLLPILSTIYFMKVKRRRIKDITNKINMKATGNDGWTNYSIMIQNQWK